MESWKHTFSGDHFSSIKSQKENSSFRIFINMGQYTRTSTRILIPQTHPLPKLLLHVINQNWNQSALKAYNITSILWEISMVKLSLLFPIMTTTQDMLRKRNILRLWIGPHLLRENRIIGTYSSISWPHLLVTNNELGSHDCPPQWHIQLLWWPRMFLCIAEY